MRDPAKLRAHPSNARRHPEGQLAKLARSIERFGFTAPVLVDRGGRILAGHARVLAARRAGLKEVPTIALGLRDGEARAYVLADNRIAAESSWDHDLLRVELAELQGMDEGLPEVAGFDPGELDAFLQSTADPAVEGNGHGSPGTPGHSEAEQEAPAGPDPLDAEVLVERPTTARGDVWQLGRHRIACGDCTSETTVAALLAGAEPRLLVTDPPYCSGGFQEAGRAMGSIGTKRNKGPEDKTASGRAKKVVPRIANDTLSTRGYQAMLGRALEVARTALFAYVFTDWRMWIPLFDVVESSGYGARSMIVWDKGSPGMGMGWRSQHELIMWAVRAKAPFDNHLAQGNVVRLGRQANEFHPTQKPVELLRTMLRVTDFAPSVYDPFLGSGSTLIACEAEGRTGFGVELEPKFVDAAILRWQQQTGEKAKLVGTGETFEDVAAQRTDA